MTPRSKLLLATASLTYIMLLYSILVDQPGLLISFVAYFPGPLFAIYILLFTPNTTLNRIVLFFAFCCAIFYLDIYYLAEYIFEKKYFLRLISLLSCISAVLVCITYSFLFREKIDFKQDVLRPGFMGIVASVATLICAYSQPLSSDLANQLLAIGFYSIFPLWTVLMSKHILSNSLE